MATTIKTLTEFNDFIGDFFKTVLPEPLEMRDYTSHKYHVYDEIFGKGVFDRNKELTSGEAFLFEDSPPGTVGVKAVGIRETFFNDGSSANNFFISAINSGSTFNSSISFIASSKKPSLRPSAFTPTVPGGESSNKIASPEVNSLFLSKTPLPKISS